jgi:hypothetical protein
MRRKQQRLIPLEVAMQWDAAQYDNPREYWNLVDRWENYKHLCDDGHGNDCETGELLKTFDQWLNS